MNLIAQQYPSYQFKIICGPNENILGDQIVLELGDKLQGRIELINTQSIVHLMNCIASSSLVIANDSAPIHIATALSINSVCIFNGSRYGRFVPYPDTITKVSSVVVPEILLNGTVKSKEHYYSQLTHLNIDKVTVKNVFSEVKNKLSS